MKAIQLKDFLDFKFLSNVKAFDDGTVVFCEHTCDEKENKYDHRLMMVKGKKTIPLTNAKKESNYILDGEDSVLFTTLREKDDKDKVDAGEALTSFYRISIHGGEALKCFDVPYQVSQFMRIDEDHYAMIVNYDTRYACEGGDEKTKQERLKDKKENADYEEFTQIPFYMNGGGYTSGIVSRLYYYEVSSNTMRAISDVNIDVSQMKYDKKNHKLYCVASQRLTKPTLKDSVYVYDIKEQSFALVLEEKEYGIYTIEIMNEQVLMIGKKDVVYGNNDNPKFYLLDVKSKQVKLLYDNDMAIFNSVGSDCRFGGGQGIQMVDDVCYFLATVEEKCEVYRLDAQGNVSRHLQVEGSVDCFCIVKDTLYFIALIDNQLQEVYAYQKNEVLALTHCNHALDDKYVANYEEICYENDGVALKGWVLLPQNYDPNKQYPAILDIHGGPKTVYGKVYYHEMQLWANMGYIVFFTNPRGSDGFGSAFANIYGQYGTIDYNDLMKFTDIVVSNYSIDEKRIGVTGGSYGGFMTNWIITHTQRFACAATQRSISNWVSFYGTSDIGFHFAQDQIHGNIFDNVEKLWEHSPLKYISNAKTPTLIIHSDEDYRCPLEQGLQLYTALCDLDVEAKLVMFRKENHELSRSGLPKHRVKRLSEITAWMEKYLK